MNKPAQSKSGLRKKQRSVKIQADFYSGKDFSERELELIVATLGVSATDDCFQSLGREIREVTRKYLTDADAAMRRSRESEARKKLKALQKAIDGLDEHASGLLHTMVTAKYPELIEALVEIPDYQVCISEAIRAGLSALGANKNGRPKSRGSLHRFIWDFMAIYEGATGKLVKLPASQGGGKYKGAFFDFCKTCLVVIEDSIVDGDSDTPLMTQFKVVFEEKRFLNARKDFKVYRTIPDDNQNKQ